MNCQAVRMEVAGKQTTAFVCGSGLKPAARCKSCGSRAVVLCDWKVLKAVPIPIAELQVGNALYTLYNKVRGRGTGPFGVTGIVESRLRPGWVTVSIDYHGHPWSYEYAPDSTAYVLGPGTCDAGCCDLHRRNVDEDTDYCMEHWRAWEEIK